MDTPLGQGKLKVRLQSSILVGEGGEGIPGERGSIWKGKRRELRSLLESACQRWSIGVMEAGELAGRRVWLSMLQPGTQLFRRVTSVYLSLDQDGPIAGRADEGILRG